MGWRNFISINQSPTVALSRWLLVYLQKDSSKFLLRYPVLTMTPDEACRSAIDRVLKKNKPEFLPIAAKLAIAFTLLITIGMSSLGFLIGSNQTRLLDKQIAWLGLTVTEQVAESAKEPLLANDVLALELITANTVGQDKILGTAIYSDDHTLVTASGSVPPLRRLNQSAAFENKPDTKPINWKHFDSELNRSIISFIQPISYRDVIVGYALLSFDRSMLATAKNQTIHMVITTTMVMIGLGIMASIVMGNRLTRPINELITVSQAIVDGNYNFHVHERRKDELGILMESMNAMSKGLLRKEQVERVFSRYVSESVAKQVLQDVEQVKLGGQHVNASVLFADIVGFTHLSESMLPEDISKLLNLYFTYIADAVRFCGGHIDKYIGDCAMIVFGVPEKDPDHIFSAAACAWMINRLIDRVNQYRLIREEIPIQLRIGLNSGVMIAGNMGSADRMEYTVVGDTVNLASRLSHAGKPGQIIFTEEIALDKSLKDRIAAEPVDTISIRGKTKPISIFQVVDIKSECRDTFLTEIERIIQCNEAIRA